MYQAAPAQVLGLQSQLMQREKDLDAARTQVTDLTRMLSTWQVSTCMVERSLHLLDHLTTGLCSLWMCGRGSAT